MRQRSGLACAFVATLGVAGCVPTATPTIGNSIASDYDLRTARGNEVRAKNAAVAAAVPLFVRACVAALTQGLPNARAALVGSTFKQIRQSPSTLTFRNSDQALNALGANAIELTFNARACSIAYHRGDTDGMVAKFSAELRGLGFHEGKVKRTTNGKWIESYIKEGVEVGFGRALSSDGPNRLLLVRIDG